MEGRSPLGENLNPGIGGIFKRANPTPLARGILALETIQPFPGPCLCISLQLGDPGR